MFLEAVELLAIDKVWSGAPMGFHIAVYADKQYVAYYNSERRMMIACRDMQSDNWVYQILDDEVGWDSHNRVTFAFDSLGYIHLSGNMHAVPLRYYRTEKPGDIGSFVKINSMVGRNEDRATYPRFFNSPKGKLLFAYRDGGSGNGNEIVNIYDEKSGKWSRFIDTPLFDGCGKMNAYYSGPVRDSKNAFHIACSWRNTPDCTTAHDVSYAVSDEYNTGFRKSDGTPIELPITLQNVEIVDNSPISSGLFGSIISIDSKDRPMITYVKFDEDGNTQIYTARREKSAWNIHKTTRWSNRWAMSGYGSIPMLISFNAPEVWGDGKLFQVYTNTFLDNRQYIRFLDEDSLEQKGEAIPLYSDELISPETMHTSDWRINLTGVDISKVKQDGYVWALKWESADYNRDLPRDILPPPSTLEVVKLQIRV